MSQPTPELPLVSDTSCWSTNTKMETEISGRLYMSPSGSEGEKCVPCPLRPAPLFRSIGPTGLSASLPPHRRLRSILHRARAVRPDNANESSMARGGENANAVVSQATDRRLPFKDFLPDITTPKLCPSPRDANQETRGSHSIEDTQTFFSLQSPNNHLACPFQRRHSMGQHDPPSKTFTSRRTIVFPLTQRDTSTETLAGANRKRWSTKIRQILTAEKASGEQDISERFHSLVLSDDRPSANKNLEGSPKSDRSEPESECEVKGVWPSRRDRRPHFLPPISHSGCLLDVPFALPENSPPPSPSSIFSTPFFPLSVPFRPQRKHRDTRDAESSAAFDRSPLSRATFISFLHLSRYRGLA